MISLLYIYLEFCLERRSQGLQQRRYERAYAREMSGERRVIPTTLNAMVDAAVGLGPNSCGSGRCHGSNSH